MRDIHNFYLIFLVFIQFSCRGFFGDPKAGQAADDSEEAISVFSLPIHTIDVLEMSARILRMCIPLNYSIQLSFDEPLISMVSMYVLKEIPFNGQDGSSPGFCYSPGAKQAQPVLKILIQFGGQRSAQRLLPQHSHGAASSEQPSGAFMA